MTPPPYPRTPHLWTVPGRIDDDRVIPPDERAGWLRAPLVVEEKLDGANVSLWLDDGRMQVASRGGAGAMDRAGQLGRLRAWAAERDASLRGLLADGWAIYGEWLWLTHGTEYDLLPDWLVVLDCWHPSVGFAGLADRDRRVEGAGLVVPPRLFEGVLGSEAAVTALFGPSRFSRSGGPAEGLVLRDAAGRRCKVVDRNYRRRTDEEWDDRRHNALADALAGVDESGWVSGPSTTLGT